MGFKSKGMPAFERLDGTVQLMRVHERSNVLESWAVFSHEIVRLIPAF